MRVFLSYAHEDLQAATRLAKVLGEEGVHVWLDRSELYPGDNWQLETGKALASADAVILLVSPDWLASDQAQRELQYVIGQERFEGRVVPVLIRPVSPDAIPWVLRDSQIIEGTPDNSSLQIARNVAAHLTSFPNPTLAGSY